MQPAKSAGKQGTNSKREIAELEVSAGKHGTYNEDGRLAYKPRSFLSFFFFNLIQIKNENHVHPDNQIHTCAQAS